MRCNPLLACSILVINLVINPCHKRRLYKASQEFGTASYTCIHTFRVLKRAKEQDPMSTAQQHTHDYTHFQNLPIGHAKQKELTSRK